MSLRPWNSWTWNGETGSNSNEETEEEKNATEKKNI